MQIAMHLGIWSGGAILVCPNGTQMARTRRRMKYIPLSMCARGERIYAHGILAHIFFFVVQNCVGLGEEMWEVAVPPVPPLPETSPTTSDPSPVIPDIALERLTIFSQVETNGTVIAI